MTKREALERCQDQWEWMARTGGDKEAYFDYEDVLEDERPESLCWCCEYSFDPVEDGANCDICPLNGYAWDDGSCLRRDSVYKKWDDYESAYIDNIPGAIEGMKRHAASMVYACEWALSELEGEA